MEKIIVVSFLLLNSFTLFALFMILLYFLCFIIFVLALSFAAFIYFAIIFIFIIFEIALKGIVSVFYKSSAQTIQHG
jgi:hypothetical protein